MDIGSVRTALTGITAPVPKPTDDAKQTVQTDLPASQTVSEADKTDKNAVETATDKEATAATATSQTSSSALTSANTVKSTPRDAVDGIDWLAEQESSTTSSTSADTADSPANATVVQDTQEFAMRMHAMIQSWEGTGGTPRTAAFDQQI